MRTAFILICLALFCMSVQAEVEKDTVQATSDSMVGRFADELTRTDKNFISQEAQGIFTDEKHNLSDTSATVFPPLPFVLEETPAPAVSPSRFSLAVKDFSFIGLPLFFSGMIIKSQKHPTTFQVSALEPYHARLKYAQHEQLDRIFPFFSPALILGLKTAGVEGRSNWGRLIFSTFATYGLTALVTNGLKNSTKEMRPDGTTANSWPSGHSAAAFAGATLLHKEYGSTRSGWYSVAGYTFATATGLLRVLNNRHWVSDVLSGAGIGIFSGEAAYALGDLLFGNKGIVGERLNKPAETTEQRFFLRVFMGFGLGNRSLRMPAFNYSRLQRLENLPGGNPTAVNIPQSVPISIKFHTATVVGGEGAWFFGKNLGVGGRLRIRTESAGNWNSFATLPQHLLSSAIGQQLLTAAIDEMTLEIKSDRMTEITGDVGMYLRFPLTKRLTLGTKLLGGVSLTDKIDVEATLKGTVINMEQTPSAMQFSLGTEKMEYKWIYLQIQNTNSLKWGTGLSLSYAYKNGCNCQVFCDYDYTHKTYEVAFRPTRAVETLAPDFYTAAKEAGTDFSAPFFSRKAKPLHHLTVGASIAIGF